MLHAIFPAVGPLEHDVAEAAGAALGRLPDNDLAAFLDLGECNVEEMFSLSVGAPNGSGGLVDRGTVYALQVLAKQVLAVERGRLALTARGEVAAVDSRLYVLGRDVPLPLVLGGIVPAAAGKIEVAQERAQVRLRGFVAVPRGFVGVWGAEPGVEAAIALQVAPSGHPLPRLRRRGRCRQCWRTCRRGGGGAVVLVLLLVVLLVVVAACVGLEGRAGRPVAVAVIPQLPVVVVVANCRRRRRGRFRCLLRREQSHHLLPRGGVVGAGTVGVGPEGVVGPTHIALGQHGRLGVGSGAVQEVVAGDSPRGRGTHGAVAAEVGAARYDSTGRRAVIEVAVDRPAAQAAPNRAHGVALDGVVEFGGGGLH